MQMVDHHHDGEGDDQAPPIANLDIVPQGLDVPGEHAVVDQKVDAAQHHEARQRILDETVVSIAVLAVEIDAGIVR